MGDEAPIQRACLDWLEANGVVHWRNALGGVRLSRGGRRKNPMAGFPDLCGLIPETGGLFFAVECKAPKGKLSEAQLEWRERLESQGVLYIVARSAFDVAYAISPFLSQPEPLTHLGAYTLEPKK